MYIFATEYKDDFNLTMFVYIYDLVSGYITQNT